MKVRNCFVSNSSSSSFICCISGREAGGYDVVLDDVDMIACNRHHIMDRDYVQEFARKIQERNSYEEFLNMIPKEFRTRCRKIIDELGGYSGCVIYDMIDEINVFRYELPCTLCPVCNLEYFTDEMLLKYILWDSGYTRKELKDNIRSFFTDSEAFWSAIEGVQI